LSVTGGGRDIWTPRVLEPAVSEAVSIAVGPVMSTPAQIAGQDVLASVAAYRVAGAVHVVLNENKTWFQAEAGSAACPGAGIRGAASAAVSSALGRLPGVARMESEGFFGANLTAAAEAAGAAMGAMGAATPAACPGTPLNVSLVPTETQLGYAVRYEFVTEPLTLAEVDVGMQRMRTGGGASFSSAVVAALNENPARGHAATTRALQANLDNAVTAVHYVVDVRVYTPAGATVMEASGVLVGALQRAIESGGVSAGMVSSGLTAVVAADYVCAAASGGGSNVSGGVCSASPVQFALPPPSPPPPAAARSVAAMSIGGYTAATFGDEQKQAFIRAVARVAGVDPASIVVLEVADDASSSGVPSGVGGKKRLLQAGGGVRIRFAIDSTGGEEADQVQARITNAEQAGELAVDLKAEPALAAVTTAGGVTGSFEIVTPPMPPPAVASPPPPGGATCGGVVEQATAAGILTDGSTASSFYSHSLDCTWVIGDGAHAYVSLRFTRFMTEFGNDFVEVFDGRGADSPSLGRFSGDGGSARTNGPPLPNDGMAINSTQPYIAVRFSSDATTQERGFAMEWTSGHASPSPPPPTPLGGLGSGSGSGSGAAAPELTTPPDHVKVHCQEPVLVTGASGEVSDGTLPAVEYLPSSVCIYLIRSNLQRVKLTFSRFDLESNYDFLHVYSADSFADVEGLASNDAAQNLFQDAHKMVDLSGSTAPAPFISDAKTLALVFRSDSSVQGLGFAATWWGCTS
jgi:hypothetical protein